MKRRLPAAGILRWTKPGEKLAGEGVNCLLNVLQRMASTPSIDEVMEITLVAAKSLANAAYAYVFIEHQGHKDEPICAHKSLPHAALCEVLPQAHYAEQIGLEGALDNNSCILPLISRSRRMGAIVLKGIPAGRMPEPQGSMVHLLAAQTAIVLDNLILSHNEWTRLPNLSAIKPHIGEAIRAATSPVALLFIDIDDFKKVNALVGYLGGAELLIQFAHRLQNCAVVRSAGTLGHISGDEFLFVLDRMPNGKADAQQIAQTINQVLRAPFLVNGRSLPVTVSTGISIYPEDARTVKELLEHSSKAVLLAKRGGKNCYRIFRRKVQTK
jgi:diguanylate cyclase (GGDEF)-like protein